MTQPITVPPVSGGTPPAPQAPPAAGSAQPPAGAAPAVGQPPAVTPPDPDSPEGLQERLRRRQAVIDQQADELRAWRALGADPTAVQGRLAGTQQAAPQTPPPAPAPAPTGGPAVPPAPVDVEAIRAQIQQDVEAKVKASADRRVIEADVVAALTGRIGVSPQSALALLGNDLATINLAANGHADPLEVEVAIRALLTREPGLAVQAGPRFGTPADQGPRGGGPAPTLAEQIAAARTAGNTRLAIALERSKLTPKA